MIILYFLSLILSLLGIGISGALILNGDLFLIIPLAAFIWVLDLLIKSLDHRGIF